MTVQEQGAAVPYEQTDIDSMVVEHMAQLTEDGKARALRPQAIRRPSIELKRS